MFDRLKKPGLSTILRNCNPSFKLIFQTSTSFNIYVQDYDVYEYV